MMRIVSGKFKGRNLEAPEDRDIRPTAARVKEALFSMILPDLPDAVCLDLFAGTGNLGLEALSRGAKRVYFCDNSRKSRDIIKRNIACCKAEGDSICLWSSYERALGAIKEKLDIVFLDPPYDAGLWKPAMLRLQELDLLTEDSIVICEKRESDVLEEQIGRLEAVKSRKYGKIELVVYK